MVDMLHLEPLALAFLARAVTGAPADVAVLEGFTPDARAICDATLRANGNGRADALRDALQAYANGGDLLAAILKGDPMAPLPGCTTWADMSALLHIDWAWRQWLPLGLLALLVADVGVGKSALALRIAATFLRGDTWPDGAPYNGPRGKVVWVECEAAQAINRDRAEAWGLPLDQILTPLVDPLADADLGNPEHRALLQAAIQRPDVKLVVVDSLRGAHRGDENSSELFELLIWLAGQARDSGKAMLVLHHLRKKGLQDGGDTGISLDRVRGSSAIVQAARLVWALDAPDPLQPARKRLSVLKSSLARFPDPVGLEIDDAGVHFGAAPEPPREESQLDKACDLLKALLRKSPVAQTDLQEEATGAGISWDTMKRAKKRLGVVANRDGRQQRWYWALPVSDERW